MVGGDEPTPSAPPAAPAAAPVLSQEEVGKWKARLDRCKKKRADLARDWSINIDYRRGKPFETASDEDRVAVSIDWSQTKAKQASLFSAVPTVMLTPRHPAFAPAIPIFAKKLNETITDAKVGIAMDECLPDVINAAGIAAVIVGFESRQEMKRVPKVDTTLMDEATKAEVLGNPKAFDSVPQVHDQRFYCRRISPGELLWPTEFAKSDFDEAPWLGYSGRMTWAEAKATFKLDDAVKSEVVGQSTAGSTGGVEGAQLRNAHRTDPDGDSETDVVEYDEIYYWAHRFDADCFYFSKIRRLVFIRGLDKAVIDEDYKGQQMSSDGSYYVGVTKLPIRVLTLTYISDEAIPPSDTAVGRPQVDEMIKFRSQMMQQRDHSLPMRWFDVNRTDPAIVDALMKGTWQGMIPVNGDGSKAIGEVARASQPPEGFEHNRIISNDIQQSWQTGPNQTGDFNEGQRSASEANIVQSNFNTRIGYERARVASFFCGIAEVLAGLVAMFGNFETPEIGKDGLQRLQAWDPKAIGNCYAYTIRTDSTVLLDSNQRMHKLSKFLDLTAKSGYVKIEPVLKEIAALAGLDPEAVIEAPAPKGPEPPNVSFRVSAEDLKDITFLAAMVKAGYAPGPQEIEAAKQILMETVQAPKSAGPTDGSHTGEQPVPGPLGDPNAEMNVQDQTPDWNLANRIDKRMNDGSGA